MALGHGRVSTNNFSTANFIVDGDGLDQGATHTTIQGAIDDASGGESIFIRPGTYVENLTLKSDLSFFAYGFQNDTAEVTIEGKVDPSTSVQSLFQGIIFENPLDSVFEDTGATSGGVSMIDCKIIGDGANDLIVNSNTGRAFTMFGGTVSQPAGAKVFSFTGGTMSFRYVIVSAGSSTISTISAGTLNFSHCLGMCPFQTTGTASFNGQSSTVSSNNQICIDSQGSGGGIMQINSLRTNGSTAAMNIGAGSTVVTTQLDINTVNNTPISGAGNIWYDSVGFIQGGNHTIAPTRSGGATRIGLLRLETALDEVYGGTGTNTYATGDILYASAANTLAKLAAGTNGHVLTLSAGVPVWQAASGGSIPDEVFYYKASDFDALETNFAPLVQDNGSNAKVLVRAFDDSTEEYVNFSLKVPADIDTSGTVTFRVWMYAATAAASRNVALTFDHRPLDNSESWDQTYTSEDSGDIAIDATQDDITEATWTETATNLAWAADDIVLCRLSRPNAAANDLVGDLYILGFAVEIPRA